MSTPIFSVVHATARESWLESHTSFFEATDDVNRCEYILSVDERFGEFVMPYSGLGFKSLLLPDTEPQNSVANWNYAARHATGKIIILNADDFRFPPHWDTELLKVIPDLDEDFAVHVSTGSPDVWREDNLMSFVIMSRKRYEHQGGYALHPRYESMESDMDFTEHAYRDGVVIQARHLLFEHIHPTWREVPKDKVFLWQNRPEAYVTGATVLNRRRQEGFCNAAF